MAAASAAHEIRRAIVPHTSTDTASTSASHPAHEELLDWARGTPTPGSARRPVGLCDRREAVGRVRELLGAEAHVLCREDVDGDPGVATLEGDPAPVGEELVLGDDLFVQVESYAGAAYLPLVGPTLLRVAEDDDVASLADDLDATAAGDLPPVLADPQLQLADRCGLGAASCGGPRRRVHVDAAGDVRTTPAGPVLGGADATADELDAAWVAAGGCTTTCVDPAIAPALDAARRSQPGWARILTVLDLLHAMRAAVPGDWSAVGLGDAGAEDRADLHPRAADWPVLLAGPDGPVLLGPDGRHRAAVGTDAATLVDALLATGSAHAAAERCAPALRIDPAIAGRALGDLRSGLAARGLELPGAVA